MLHYAMQEINNKKKMDKLNAQVSDVSALLLSLAKGKLNARIIASKK